MGIFLWNEPDAGDILEKSHCDVSLYRKCLEKFKFKVKQVGLIVKFCYDGMFL